jgi:geranylgeranylglycerol-phosphate geranylgeranyltransferase
MPSGRTIWHLLRTARPHNGLVCAALLYCGARHADRAGLDVLGSALALILICAGTHLVNDLIDLPVDRVNRPERPLAAGRTTPDRIRRAAALALVSGTVVGVLAAPQWWPGWLLWALGGPAYSLVAKGRGWLGPVWVAVLVGSCYLVPAAADGVGPSDLKLSVLIASFVLFRETIKGREDRVGDVCAGLRGCGPAPGGTIGACTGMVLLMAPLVGSAATVLWLPAATPVARMEAVFVLCTVATAPCVASVATFRSRHWPGTLLKLAAVGGLPLLLAMPSIGLA